MRHKLLLSIAPIVTVLHLSGCSLIGLGIGTMSDQSRPDTLVLSRGDQFDRLVVDDSITVTVSDDSVVTGRYLGLKARPTQTYARAFENAMTGTVAGKAVPKLGMKLNVVAHEKPQLFGARQTRIQCSLIGFNPGKILLLRADDNKRADYPVSSIDTIRGDQGNLLFAGTLLQEMEAGRIPFMSNVGVARGIDTLWVPADCVTRVQQHVSQHGWRTGLIIGAAIDVAVIIAAAVSFHQSFFNGSGTWKL